MPRRGRCRCGSILLFGRTSHGYKTRCPSCQSVVRLRSAAAKPAPVAVAASSALADAPFDFCTPPAPPVTPATSLIELEVYRPTRGRALWPYLVLGGAAVVVVAAVAVLVVLGVGER